MKLLIDTHALLWWAQGDPRLSERARALMSDTDNDLWISMASVWELSIKVGLNKLRLKDSVVSMIRRLVADEGFQLMTIQLTHFEALADLEHHHRDPFDRMLVAQARLEEHSIVTKDDMIGKYPVQTIW